MKRKNKERHYFPDLTDLFTENVPDSSGYSASAESFWGEGLPLPITAAGFFRRIRKGAGKCFSGIGQRAR